MWLDTRERVIPVRLIVAADGVVSRNRNSIAEQTLDLVIDLVQHFLGHPVKRKKINGNYN
jgi:hypothetical protein